MPRTMRLYPHRVSSALSVRLSELFDPDNDSLDWSSVTTTEDEDAQETRYDLSAVNWQTASFKLTATLPAEELSGLLPTGSSPEKDAALLVSARCARTKLRRRIVLKPGPRGVWTGEVSLRRRDVKSTVHLLPFLVRRTDIPSTAPGVATGMAGYAGAVIAEGRPLSLVVDEVMRNPLPFNPRS